MCLLILLFAVSMGVWFFLIVCWDGFGCSCCYYYLQCTIGFKFLCVTLCFRRKLGHQRVFLTALDPFCFQPLLCDGCARGVLSTLMPILIFNSYCFYSVCFRGWGCFCVFLLQLRWALYAGLAKVCIFQWSFLPSLCNHLNIFVWSSGDRVSWSPPGVRSFFMIAKQMFGPRTVLLLPIE